MDRPDIAYASKELCRCFAHPSRAAVDALKRLVRYLVGRPRLLWHFNFQPLEDVLTTSVDTDFGGCVVTRRSTSGGASMRGKHLVKHWSLTQSTLALSSAEAELGGICKGTSIAIGLASVARDLGINWELVVQTDAAAAIGVCRRRGLGKIRHLSTADLWIQDKVRQKEIDLVKIPGQQNVADILTKHVDRTTLERHMLSMGLRQAQGRAQSAPTIDYSSAMFIPPATLSRMTRR